MALSSVSNVASSASTQLKLEDLLRVMLTELSYQDPLKPVDNKDFMAQVAQFSSLDATRQLNGRLDTLLSLQSINQTVGLLGKTIDATTATGQTTGKVTALSIVGGEPKMTITTASGEVVSGIAFSQLQNIR
ncbi:flagellar hook assembly protein FlgD [Niveibacterium sp. COAC-50]|uniref:flagellar hook assembly protein FlgD n=1 Tax=Niveibacterium sp. COAC-50 TaxID=2729384 RepID=UPI0015543CED|nr:flagellar hook capping FlgD N-terminal domain-containing protein [Niveibacterium sp. COAC-50]